MILLKYDEAMVWLNGATQGAKAKEGVTWEDVEDWAEGLGVWFEQDAVQALHDFAAGTPGKNDPGSRNNSCLARRPGRR